MKNYEVATIFVAFFAVFGALAVLILNKDNITITQVLLTFALVLITFVYVMRTTAISSATHKQAEASLKMAEEMRDTRFSGLRPIIAIEWNGSNHKTEISALFKNLGPGLALNLECYLTHPKFNFEFKHDNYTILEIGEVHNISLPSEQFDFKEWAGLAINCKYQSVYRESFHSVLKFNAEEDRHLEIIEQK